MAERAFVVLSVLLLLAAGCRGVLGIHAARGDLDSGDTDHATDAGRGASGRSGSLAGRDSGMDEGGSDEAGKNGMAGRLAAAAGSGGASSAGASGMPGAGAGGMPGGGAGGMSGAGAGGSGGAGTGGASGSGGTGGEAGSIGMTGGGAGGAGAGGGGGSGGAPACPLPPSACQGEDSGDICQSDTSYVHCETDAEGCVTATDGTCDVRKPCRGEPGAAQCTCLDPPTNNECPAMQQAGTRCAAGSALHCGTDSLGCLRFMQTICPSGVCRGAYPNGTCVDEQSYGWPTELAGMQEHVTGALAGTKIRVDTTSVLRRFGFITKQAAQHVILALYDDQAGLPHDRIASSGNNTVGSGVNEFAVALPPSNVTLSPGTYWLMVSVDASTQIAHSTASVPLAYVAYVHGTPLPATLTGVAIDTMTEPNLYITVLPQ